jgi:glycosyltransferase involved in cell wall biosynthesis
VIATHETGITTVAVHGVDAWVIPARDEEAIHQALWRLTEDRGLNESMGKNARMIGNESNTWQDYGDAILARVGEAITW